MAGETAKRDENEVPSLLAVSSADGVSLVRVWADPTTHRLLVQLVGSGNGGYQQATSGVIDGSNQTYTWATAPNALCVDNRVIQKVSLDGTVNWTGTTTTILTIAPNFDLFAVA